MSKVKRDKKSKKSGLKDERFEHVTSNPLFCELGRNDRKVVLDDRFSAALTNRNFSTATKIDRRGKKRNKAIDRSLSDLYELESAKKKNADGENQEEAEESDFDEDVAEESVTRLDLARGEGNLSSSSDDDSDEEEDFASSDRAQLDVDLVDIDGDAERVEWASARLAVCNLDWNVVACDDIFILVSSFLPPNGSVRSVAIYLSDFGAERIAQEEKTGPVLDLKKVSEEDDNDDEIDDETRLAVRKYQMDRLKYYYALVEFDSANTAATVYETCDGHQFEMTGLKMDLRFVPDEMTFESDRLKERITADDVNVGQYKSKDKKKNSASLTSGKLNWDEDDDVRTEAIRKAFVTDDAAGRLIASSDEEEDEEEEEKRKLLTSLLQKDETRSGLEVTWEGDEKADADGTGSEYESVASSDDEQQEQRNEDEDDEDVGEKISRQAKKKRSYKEFLALKKETAKQRKLAARKTEETNASSPKKTGKRKSEAKTAEAVDTRFSALFENSAFAIDHSSKHYKGSSLLNEQAAVKRAKRENTTAATKSEDLMSSLKRKANAWKKK